MRMIVDGVSLYFDVEGAQLAVDGARLAERPTVVVLHGGPGFDQGYLRPGLGALSAYAQLIFIDLRGQGRSGRPPVETCTLERMADDVAGLCDGLGIARPVVFGHSGGGFVALHLALRHPGVAGGLILCDTTATLRPLTDDDPPPSLAERTSPETAALAARMFGGDFSAGTMRAFAEHVAPAYAGPGHMDVPGRLFPLSSFAGEVAQHFFGTLAPDYDLRPGLARIGVPTLVVVGRYDWVCPPAGSRVLAAGIPDAELVEFAESGHFPFTEEPAAFRAAVGRFLMSNPAFAGARLGYAAGAGGCE
ncbi:alpha/beta hydrolase [Actinoplanes sp. KI2]|uniref:alpha/beta fold hydrolase n=1 Tax=Actinoplanes sp. KI2 TaxID=2983315 RepID=UPI0021D5D4A1|nr:alpha/beta hydrolase [Actinoplanes sp. KI2]MCU7727508.1 alpha/beta hydrolase [Actinoplanes sp. KI2]